MQFRFEDILKNIIPGSLLLISLLFYFLAPLTGTELQIFLVTYIKDYSAVEIVVFLTASYLFGYLIDALASWGEYYIIYKLFGTPAFKLFNQETNRINFTQKEVVLNNLDLQYHIYDRKFIPPGSEIFTKKQASDLFNLANIYSQRCADDLTKQKLKEYYYAYIFSRNIFFSVIISSLILLIGSLNHLNFTILTTLIVLNILFLIRRRDKAYYYSRQVLIACIKII